MSNDDKWGRLWIQYAHLADGGFGRVMWESDFQDFCKDHLSATRELPDIEAVSACVHAAWIASKLAQDVESRKAEDGEELMVRYEQLSEKAKELDRGTVRAVYAVIEATRVAD